MSAAMPKKLRPSTRTGHANRHCEERAATIGVKVPDRGRDEVPPEAGKGEGHGGEPVSPPPTERRGRDGAGNQGVFFTTSTMPCTLAALFASIAFSSAVSSSSMIFSTPLPPMTMGTPMYMSL